MKKSILCLFLGISAIVNGCQQASAEATLKIGQKAPQLDVENWISLGDEKFKPVTKFEDGKVYVVEFWATWCGPCIASMPHLAKLQEKYADKGVQIISITSDKMDAIDNLLDKEASNGEGDDKTYRDITSHYCLTSDPDDSASRDYMLATRQNGIPAAYIVGRDGRLEWTGHPMEMDKPLQQILDGTWDRAEFAKEFDDRQHMMDLEEKLNEMASQAKNPDDPIAMAKLMLPVVAKYEQMISSPAIKMNVKALQMELMLAGEPKNPATVALVKSMMDNDKVSAPAKHDIAWKTFEMSMEDDNFNPKILEVMADTLPKLLSKLDEDSHPTVLDTLAHIQFRLGKKAEAIKTAQKAYDLSGQQPEYEVFLNELKEDK